MWADALSVNSSTVLTVGDITLCDARPNAVEQRALLEAWSCDIIEQT